MPNHDAYLAYTRAPWGVMFYQQLWAQLSEHLQTDKKLDILDFGSGLGITAGYLVELGHRVLALEPDEGMLALATPGGYTQRIGGLEVLQDDDRFDMICCHNVLEYIEDKQAALRTLCAHLRPGGRLSIVKHNTPGKVMAAAVFEQNPTKALELLQGAQAVSANFGAVGEYESASLPQWLGDGMKAVDCMGLRCAFGLVQNNNIKSDAAWCETMLAWEQAVCRLSPYREVAYFHHLIFQAV